MTSTRGSGLGGLRWMMLIAASSVALALWPSSAFAARGVIVWRVQAYDAPSESAGAVAELRRGATVLVLDNDDSAGAAQGRPGWVAIRLPGRGGVGYVRAEAFDPAAVPQSVDTESPAGPSNPAQAHPRLMAGGFLPLEPARFLLGLGTGAAWIGEQSAARNHIGDTGPIFHASLGLTIYDVFTLSASGGFIVPSDDASFSQQVMPEHGGEVTTADSSLTVMRYSLAVGLRTPFWALSPTEQSWFAGALFVDFGVAGISGTRSISDCVDCRSDDLELPGGTFWRAGLDLAAPHPAHKTGYGFTAAYQRYLAGTGLTHELQLGMTLWWH